MDGENIPDGQENSLPAGQLVQQEGAGAGQQVVQLQLNQRALDLIIQGVTQRMAAGSNTQAPTTPAPPAPPAITPPATGGQDAGNDATRPPGPGE